MDKPTQMCFRDVTAAVEVSHNEKRKFLIEALVDEEAMCRRALADESTILILTNY